MTETVTISSIWWAQKHACTIVVGQMGAKMQYYITHTQQQIRDLATYPKQQNTISSIEFTCHPNTRKSTPHKEQKLTAQTERRQNLSAVFDAKRKEQKPSQNPSKRE